MRGTFFSLSMGVAASISLSNSVFAEHLGGGGGGELRAIQSGNCISPSEKAEALKRIAAYKKLNPQWDAKLTSEPSKHSFYPQAGRFWGDLFPNNFVDLNPSAGILDYACSNYTYDGHQGIDTDIVSWTQKDIGVPIFAALDGVVVDTDDGHFDEQTSFNPLNKANYVILDHGGGHQTYYWHMKTGSVAVQNGQLVKAGEQLGLTASSGFSTGPHLHFESIYNGEYYEPFSGDCNLVDSNWVDQPAFERGTYLREFNIAANSLSGWGGPPLDRDRKGTFSKGVQRINWWIVAHNVPENSPWRVRFLRPDETVAFDSGLTNFNHGPFRSSWWWWDYFINFNVAGEWTLELEYNGSVYPAPLTITETGALQPNRPPAKPTLSLWQLQPDAEGPIRCNIEGSLLFRDPDYDQVRYRYVWSAGDVILRDVVSAATTDMLPGGAAAAGDLLTCTVTPMDDVGVGESALVSAQFVALSGWIVN